MTEEEWLASTDPEKMLEFLGVKASKRKLRLFVVACCRRIWNLLNDARSKNAVEVAEQFVEGLATRHALVQARTRAEQAAKNIKTLWTSPRSAAWAACWVACRSSGMLRSVRAAISATAQRASDEAWQSVQRVGVDAAYENALQARYSTQRNEQNWAALFLHDIFGNPFHPISINPTWLTTTVTDQASTAYEERALPSGELDTTRLAILADALEEACCDNREILGHLRGPGPHVRGCFALDLLLGKE